MNRNNIRIKEPCHADWSEMDGSEKKRFCGDCSKHVHDLSAMTEYQATMVIKTVEKPCVRYSCNPDGSVRFKPSRRVFLSRAGMLAGGLVIGGMPAAAAVLPQPETAEACEKSLLDKLSEAFWSLFEEEPEIEIEMGDIEPEIEMMGKIEMPPEPEPPVMGGIMPAPEPPPKPEQVRMGRIAMPPTVEE